MNGLSSANPLSPPLISSYGVVYLLFEAIPIVFEQTHGLNPGLSGCVFLALLTGGAVGVLGYLF